MRAFGRDPDEPQGSSTLAARLARWAARVVEWNQSIDLTAARSDDELVDLLLADAAAVSRVVRSARTTNAPDARTGDARETWLDVGTGAGAPGLGLALLEPELPVTLLEPKTKRVAFLRSVLGELERADVRVERNRSDARASSSTDVAISRATFPPEAWLREGARVARCSVWVLLAQGEPPVSSEMQLVNDQRYVWPLTGAERRLLQYARLAKLAE